MTNRTSSVEAAVVSTLLPALIVLIVLILPFANHTLVGIELHSPHLPGILANAVVGILDFVILLLISACLAALRYRSQVRPVGIVLVGTGVLAGVSLIGLAIAPSRSGVMLTLRLISVVAIVYATRLIGSALFNRFVVTAIKVTVASQATWALWQSFSGTGRVRYSSIAGFGSFGGPYELAAFLALGMTIVAWSSRLHPLRSWDYAVIGLASAAIATTFGRTGVLSVSLIATTYGIGWVRTRSAELAWISGLSVLPMVFVGAILRTGWLERVSQPLNDLDSGRLELVRQAILVIREHPVFGVGPGQYGPAIADLPPDVINYTMVHVVPMLVAAEFGIAVGIASLFWLVALGVRSLRVSVYSTALLGAVVPYLFLDNMHYVFPAGFAMFGLWLATLDSDRYMFARKNEGLKRTPENQDAFNAIQKRHEP